MLEGKRFVITAGPTWEALDPVRGITNRSSGKMGYALAEVAIQNGAEVVLITGPVCITPPEGAQVTKVQSAVEMYQAVHSEVTEADVFISVAAVADYRPSEVQPQKIKKQGDTMTLTLVKNPDIVASVGQLKQNRPFTVGFAAETQNIEAFARGKLIQKGLDLIAANDVSNAELGFGSDENRLWVFSKNERIDLGRNSKLSLAQALLVEIESRL
ncbi:MAG: phosphopantothenoylcysteine decarboxylase/phosphopantothenate--cysteine ligase [Saprospiraceae bacterium]